MGDETYVRDGPCTCHIILVFCNTPGVFNTMSGGIGRTLVILGGTRHVYAGSGPPAQAGALPMASGSARVVAPNVYEHLVHEGASIGRCACTTGQIISGIRMTANGVPAFTPVLPGHHPQIFTYSRILILIHNKGSEKAHVPFTRTCLSMD